MNITLPADTVRIEHARNDLSVALEGVDIREVISQVGKAELLDAIGKGDCIDHFGIEEAGEDI